MDTKLVGDIAVTAFILKTLKLGYRVSLPYGDRFKYDLILDVDHRLYRIQIKKGRKCKNTYRVNVMKSNTNRKAVKYTKYESTDFDFLAMYLEDLDIFYIVPSEIYTSRNWTLNVTPDYANSAINIYKEAWNLFHIDSRLVSE